MSKTPHKVAISGQFYRNRVEALRSLAPVAPAPSFWARLLALFA